MRFYFRLPFERFFCSFFRFFTLTLFEKRFRFGRFIDLFRFQIIGHVFPQTKDQNISIGRIRSFGLTVDFRIRLVQRSVERFSLSPVSFLYRKRFRKSSCHRISRTSHRSIRHRSYKILSYRALVNYP